MSDQVENITELLIEWRGGNREAFDRLLPLVHKELTKLARLCLAGERTGHTLQPSALVNEAYLRLVAHPGHSCQNRAHFFAVAAQVMRHLLVDYARQRQCTKRRGAAVHYSIDDELLVSPERLDEVIEIDDALQRLAMIDPRKSQVVVMRFFGGLSVEETAEALGVAPNTVIRDWSFARAWLRTRLEVGTAGR